LGPPIGGISLSFSKVFRGAGLVVSHSQVG
jgi:hypothetical protein